MQLLYCNDTTNKSILQDIKNGKKQPWRPKKIRNLQLADSLHRLGQHKRANRVWWCSSALGFLRNLETGEKKLEAAEFCRERLCPMCQWRKSIKVFHQVSKVMDKVELDHKNLVPIFLTLTMKNCDGSQLSENLDNVLLGWKKLIDHYRMRNLSKGWFRALEITYNERENTFHPHIHAILLVEKSYFKGKDYMSTLDWVQMWRTALKLDYDPICDIRKVKTNKGKYKAVAEVAKYTLKDSEFLTDKTELTDKLVDVLGSSMKGRRLFAFGGIMKKIAKELGAEKPDEGDLVHIDEENIREDVATLIEIYHWDFGLSDYAQKE